MTVPMPEQRTEPLTDAYLDQMQAHVDEGGRLSHRNATDLLTELRSRRAAEEAQRKGAAGTTTRERAISWACECERYGSTDFTGTPPQWLVDMLTEFAVRECRAARAEGHREGMEKAATGGYWSAGVFHEPPNRRGKRDGLSGEIVRVDGKFATEQEAVAAAQAVIAHGRPRIDKFIDKQTARPNVHFELSRDAVDAIGRALAIRRAAGETR